MDEAGRTIAELPGGPGLFITAALKTAAVDYQLVAGPGLALEILIKNGREFGRVPKKPARRLIDATKANNWTIVSTVLDEWQPTSLPAIPRLFMDVQGYVRDGDDFGTKKQWPIDKDLPGGCFCLKGTEEEMKYLPAAAVEQQKQKMLVVTKGAAGADIFFEGNYHQTAPEPVENLENTIGAGDTFLAYMVIAMQRGFSPFDAADFATKKTTDFLKSKILVTTPHKSGIK